MTHVHEVDTRYRHATGCRLCFSAASKLRPGVVDIAQPRWVGPRYGDTKPRVLFILLNPGSGESDDLTYNVQARRLIHGYHHGRAKLRDVLVHQRSHMPAWGRRRFLPFNTTAPGLNLDDIVFLNVGLCSTDDNKTPPWMLRQCFDKHTRHLIRFLDPELVVLSGGDVKQFHAAILKDRPEAQVETMLHYAHRKSRETERRDHERIRAILERLKHQ